jgi:hypothetical protein
VVVKDFAYLPLLPGDFNSDGSVDGADLMQWQSDYGLNRKSDGDGDGDSDGGDFFIWQRNAAASSPTVSSGVPEPTTLTLLALSIAPCRRLRWQRVHVAFGAMA